METDVERLLDPELKAILAATDMSVLSANWFPDSDVSAWAKRRRQERAVLASAKPLYRPAGFNVEDHAVRAPNGPEVLVRTYTPATSTGGLRPAFLWLYGGAFTFGTLDEWDEQYVRLAQDFDAVLVGVDYRKAPDHPFPAAPDDCYATLEWLAKNARSLGVDADRIVVGGQSGGGTYTAAIALMARDRGGPKIAFQMPMFAALDDRIATPSSRTILDQRIVNHKQYDRAWQHYLGAQRGGAISPYAAPARATDLAGLPPAYMYVGGLDPMRDENIEYAMRLMAANVAVELHVYPGGFHGFSGMPAVAGRPAAGATAGRGSRGEAGPSLSVIDR